MGLKEYAGAAGDCRQGIVFIYKKVVVHFKGLFHYLSMGVCACVSVSAPGAYSCLQQSEGGGHPGTGAPGSSVLS